jgi:hypothetical protein
MGCCLDQQLPNNMLGSACIHDQSARPPLPLLSPTLAPASGGVRSPRMPPASTRKYSRSEAEGGPPPAPRHLDTSAARRL